MRSGSLAAATLALIGIRGEAQPLYVEVTATHLPAGLAGRCMNAAAGDADDDDGDLDLAVANVQFVLDEPERDVLLLNDSHGVLTPAASFRRVNAESARIGTVSKTVRNRRIRRCGVPFGSC